MAVVFFNNLEIKNSYLQKGIIIVEEELDYV
jgi:hypothetical protein